MEEWKEYKLGEICTKIGSGATPKGGKEAYLGGDTSLIRSQNVLDFSFSWDGLAYIDDEQAAKLNGVIIERGDVLLNITGDSVARACIVPESALPARVNQHVSIIRGNTAIVLNDYILYFLQYKKPYLLSLSKGGATRNALTKGMIEDLLIPLPPIFKQAEIVRVLKSLDDKIEVNRRINDNLYLAFIEVMLIWLLTSLRNDNLEQQAQALFKYWFADFEPFKDGEFKDTELGLIPKGWEVVSLSAIADYINGLAMQKYRPIEGEKGLPVLKIKELGQGNTDNSSELCSPSLIGEKYIIDDGDIIFSWSGTLMVKVWCGGKCGLNQHLFVVEPKDYPHWFAYQWTRHHLDNFIHIAKDKAVTMGHIKRGELDKAKVVVPDGTSMAAIDSMMKPLHSQIISNKIESRRLASLRDTLLPRLMSGELRVGDVTL